MIKKSLLFVVLSFPLIAASARADICEYAPDMDLAKIRSALLGVTIQTDPPAAVDPDGKQITGKVAAITLSPTDKTSIQIDVSASGKEDGTQQTITDADLGHLSLVCKDSKGIVTTDNLAGSLLNSGVSCASAQFAGNIPSSPVNLKCVANVTKTVPVTTSSASLNQHLKACFSSNTSQVDMENCVNDIATREDALLNTTYHWAMGVAKTLDSVDPSGNPSTSTTVQDSIRKAERLWVSFRTAECASTETPYQGGSEGGIVASECVAKMSAARSRQLRADLADFNQ